MVSDLSSRSGLGGFDQYDSLREDLLVLNARACFLVSIFFLEILFHNKKIISTLAILCCNC